MNAPMRTGSDMVSCTSLGTKTGEYLSEPHWQGVIEFITVISGQLAVEVHEKTLYFELTK